MNVSHHVVLQSSLDPPHPNLLIIQFLELKLPLGKLRPISEPLNASIDRIVRRIDRRRTTDEHLVKVEHARTTGTFVRRDRDVVLDFHDR